MVVIAAATTVFVELDRDVRRLRLPDQPRYGPGVRIGFLQVVEGPVREVLAHVVPGSVVPQKPGRTAAAPWFDGQSVHFRNCVVAVLDSIAHVRQERLFDRPTKRQNLGVPLEFVVYVMKSAIVKFVADGQR